MWNWRQFWDGCNWETFAPLCPKNFIEIWKFTRCSNVHYFVKSWLVYKWPKNTSRIQFRASGTILKYSMGEIMSKNQSKPWNSAWIFKKTGNSIDFLCKNWSKIGIVCEMSLIFDGNNIILVLNQLSYSLTTQRNYVRTFPSKLKGEMSK